MACINDKVGVFKGYASTFACKVAMNLWANARCITNDQRCGTGWNNICGAHVHTTAKSSTDSRIVMNVFIKNVESASGIR